MMLVVGFDLLLMHQQSPHCEVVMIQPRVTQSMGLGLEKELDRASQGLRN